MVEDGEFGYAAGKQLPPAVEPNVDLERLAREMRQLQDAVIGTAAPPEVLAAVAQGLADLTGQLKPYSLASRPTNGWDDVRRSAHTRTFSPVLMDLRLSPDRMSAQFTLSEFYLGANGAAHGGSIPLVFDQALARLAQYQRPISRTAYLNVSFRRVTPITELLTVVGELERTEGRKHFIHGAIIHGDIITAEADALYVETRHGYA
jgi:acyl-coenzyme A thioesterase PaaI-like protein